MEEADTTEMLRLFAERHSEADPKAREVLAEFIRVTTAVQSDPTVLRELVALDESWRDTLSDSQVIKYLRTLRPRASADKRKRRRVKRNHQTG